MGSLLDTTRKALQMAGVVPNKKLGQHFVIDADVIADMVDAGNLTSSDTVLEIGAGTGNLTCEIARFAGSVIAIEYDKRLADYLKRVVATKYKNVKVIAGDALKMDFPPFNKVISNLPYCISSEIIFKLIDYGFELCILTLQEEFGYRLIATPGMREYSRLSVKVQIFSDVEGLFLVPRGSFYPVPEVNSVCVSLVPKSEVPEILSMDILDAVLRSAFNQRRKKLKNSLMTLARVINADKETIRRFISEIPEDLGEKRAEEIEPEQYIDIANELYEFLNT